MQKSGVVFEDSESEYDVSSVDEDDVDDEDSADLSLMNGKNSNGYDHTKGTDVAAATAASAANAVLSTTTTATTAVAAVATTTTTTTATGSSSSIKLIRSSNGALALIDVGLHRCRVVFALSVSTAICLCSLYRGGLYQFRSVQKTRVKHGQQHVKSFQDKFRNAFFDVYFGVFTFFAEQDFYLILLPVLYWNTDYLLAHRFATMVMNGLFIGNVIKDIFELPRPNPKIVWRPSHQTSVDSAGLEDFGFPSTHAMNAITNAVIVYLHYYEQGVIDSPLKMLAGSSLVVFYILSLSISRLYLGAHTFVDLCGGWALGTAFVSSYWPLRHGIDHYLLTTSYLPLKGAILAATALLLCPQPRPAKPTFAINALVAGCILGEMIGFRLHHDQNFSSFNSVIDKESSLLQIFRDSISSDGVKSPELFYSIQSSILVQIHSFFQNVSHALPYRALLFVRLLIGIIVLAIIRAVVKEVSGILLSLIGIPTKAPPATDASNHATAQKKLKSKKSTSLKTIVRLFTKEPHIAGQAIQKTITYTAVAFGITYGVPAVFLLMGLTIPKQ